MLTAILPIRIDQNSFWSSSRGLECVESFLKICARVSDIDQFIVITKDDRVGRLAEQQGMEISSAAIPGNTDRPYTFEQTRSLARNFLKFCLNQTDALIIADHRNLFLTADDIVMAHKAYQQDPENGVICLAFSRDYPCQYKSYFTFLDCVVIHFDEPGQKTGAPDSSQTFLPREITGRAKSGNIKISISANGPYGGISFHSQGLPWESFVTQILPFTKDGPLYGQSREILVPTSEYETLLYIDATQLSGIIFILTTPAQSGEYDTVEIFTPANAPWELGGSGSTVVNTKTHEPIFGRQQFPPAYTYDGSLCILGVKHLPEKITSVPNPFILKDSCIVTDWVDYWYTVTAQLTADNLLDLPRC